MGLKEAPQHTAIESQARVQGKALFQSLINGQASPREVAEKLDSARSRNFNEYELTFSSIIEQGIRRAAGPSTLKIILEPVLKFVRGN